MAAATEARKLSDCGDERGDCSWKLFECRGPIAGSVWACRRRTTCSLCSGRSRHQPAGPAVVVRRGGCKHLSSHRSSCSGSSTTSVVKGSNATPATACRPQATMITSFLLLPLLSVLTCVTPDLGLCSASIHRSAARRKPLQRVPQLNCVQERQRRVGRDRPHDVRSHVSR